MSLAVAKKALLENSQQHLDQKRDPAMYNLHVALFQIVQCLERIEAAQTSQARAISQLTSRRR